MEWVWTIDKFYEWQNKIRLNALKKYNDKMYKNYCKRRILYDFIWLIVWLCYNYNIKTIYFYLIITIEIVEWGDFYEK